MKKIVVIGSKGNMGRRYALILEHIGCEVIGVDLIDGQRVIPKADGYVIATPTDSHYDIIRYTLPFQKPILCEKPISKNMIELQTLLSIDNLDLSMINQYEFLINPNYTGHTIYNYFKTGNDTLHWDCINIIGLAKQSYDIKNDSLVWRCVINGQELNIADMDLAYINNIKGWVEGWRNKEYILTAHAKVMKHLSK
jgi:hypothetical protein